MTPPDPAPEAAGGNVIAAILGTGGGASGVGIAAILYETFRVDKCTEVILAQQTAYAASLAQIVEELAK